MASSAFIPAPLIVTLPDGSVEMRFTVKVPPREAIASALAFEKDVQQATARIGLALMEYGLAAFDGKHLTDDRRVWSAGRLRCATIGDGKIIITGAARGMAARV